LITSYLINRTRILFYALSFSAVFLFSAPINLSAQEVINPYVRGELVDVAPQKELHGGTVNLKSYRGKKVVVLAFSLNSCDLCLKQIKLVNDFIKKNNREKDVALIAVIRANNLEREMVFNTMKERKLAVPVILDENLEVAHKLGVNIVPSFVLLDKNGRVATKQINYVDKPIRNKSLLGMIDILRQGKNIPDVFFMPFTSDGKLRKMIGSEAPQFQLGSIDGKSFSTADYKNKTNVVLLFWHPYSPECKALIRILNDMYTPEAREKYNFVILAATSIYGQSQMDDSRKLQSEVQPGFSFLDDVDSVVGNMYNAANIPTLFIIGKDGNIKDVFTSELGYVNIEKRIFAIFDSIK
jgi:peroxiredoxin